MKAVEIGVRAAAGATSLLRRRPYLGKETHANLNVNGKDVIDCIG